MDTEQRIAALEARVAQLEQDVAAMKRFLKLDTRIGNLEYHWDTGCVVNEIQSPRFKAPLQFWTVELRAPAPRWIAGTPPTARFLVAGRVRWSERYQAHRLSVAGIGRAAVEGDVDTLGFRGKNGLIVVALEALQRQLPGVVITPGNLSSAMLHDCLERAVAAQKAAA